MMAFYRARHLLAQFIFPEAFRRIDGAFVAASVKPGSPMAVRLADQLANGNKLRELHAAYFIATQKSLCWTDVKAAVGSDRVYQHYDSVQLIRRMTAHPSLGCRAANFEKAVALFKLMWPRGVIMPSPIPNPGVSP